MIDEHLPTAIAVALVATYVGWCNNEPEYILGIVLAVLLTIWFVIRLVLKRMARAKTFDS